MYQRSSFEQIFLKRTEAHHDAVGEALAVAHKVIWAGAEVPE